MIFQHSNVGGGKFDLGVKSLKVNVPSLFEQN